MPSARPIPMTMFTAKIEMSNACPRSATIASVITIADDRHQQRDESGNDRSEDEQQDHQRRRGAEEDLAVLQVLLRLRLQRFVGRELARDRGVERAAVGRANGVDRLLHRRRVVLGLRRDLERHDQRVAILGDERLVVACVVSARTGDSLGALQRPGELLHLRAERLIVHGLLSTSARRRRQRSAGFHRDGTRSDPPHGPTPGCSSTRTRS